MDQSQEIYAAHRVCNDGGPYLTEDGISVTYRGSKYDPYSHVIRLERGSELYEYKGVFGSESIARALMAFREKLVPIGRKGD
jgi:hypothetical protein